LGSGPTGSEEIKSQPFFKDIDWKIAYARGLKPPPIRKTFKIKRADIKQLSSTERPLRKIEDWTFLRPEHATIQDSLKKNNFFLN